MKRLICFLLAYAATTTAQTTTLVPIVDCYSVQPTTFPGDCYQQNCPPEPGFWYTVSWGYINLGTTAVTLPIGLSNLVSPPPSDQGQPTVYQPGIHHNVFSTTFASAATQNQIWRLGTSCAAINEPQAGCGDTLLTPNTNRYCGQPQLACWDTNGNGVCDLSEDINGDGKCDPLDCQGATGPQGAPGPQGMTGATGAQGPAGPAGISPAIQTVSVPSNTATATATCAIGQILLNGGGTCAVPNTNTISGRVASSAPSGTNAWTVSCSTGNATAVVLCAAAQQ